LDTFVFFIHVLFAAIWVGGNVALQVVGTRAWRARKTGRMPELAADFEFVGTRVFAPSSLLILLSGIWLVVRSQGEFAFREFWIWSALVAFAYSFLSGLLYLTPRLEKAKKVWLEEGPSSEQGAQIMHGLFVVARIELAVLVFIIYDMVAKPFS
jgi:uncharacterized membrane protein